jgi:uncharacterized protein with FMN-binding domain
MMRRAIFAITATAAGLVALLSFKTTALNGPPALPPTQSIPTATEPRRSTGTATRAVTGPVVNTKWGPVQVRVTLAAGRISDVQALQLPHRAVLSQEISAYASPRLRQEALRGQSARIDVVSDATYTSQGYRQSLQAALDAAR